jgi:rRNA maturation RNase YbeY
MNVEIVRRGAGRKVPSPDLKNAAAKILHLVGQNKAELSLSLVGDDEIQSLNLRYREKNRPTDVLSFPSDEALPGGERLLGDVVISVETAKRQAKERKIALRDELVVLLIHGILHLIGYDHERSAKDAKIMGRLEKKIYRKLCEQGVLKV